MRTRYVVRRRTAFPEVYEFGLEAVWRFATLKECEAYQDRWSGLTDWPVLSIHHIEDVL